MDGIWITPEIMELKRSLGEKFLFARICYRAAISPTGQCTDSNPQLAEALGMHPQSVSELVQKLHRDELLFACTDKTKANLRTIDPIRKFLIAYKEKADSYKEKTDSTSKEIPDSTPNTLSGISLEPISEILIPSKEIPDSSYKDIKLNKTLENAKAVSENAGAIGATIPLPPSEPEKPPTPQVPAAPPPPELSLPKKKKYGDGALQQQARTFFLDNPDEFPAEMYPGFLDHWTEIVQHSENAADIGQELWRTQRTWSISKRLGKWHTGYLRDLQNQQKRDESATRQNHNNAAQPAGRSRTASTGSSRPVKRTPVITPERLRRDSPSGRNNGQNGHGGTIIIDVDGSK